EEGTLAKWHVKAGDQVRSGDVIAEIETDKATMEVEAVDEGVVESILVPEGTEEVKVNTPIARLKGEGAASAAPPAARPRDEPEAQAPRAQGAGARLPKPQHRIFASPLARRLAKAAGVDLAGVEGSGPHGRIIRRDLEGIKGHAAAPPAAAPPAAALRQALSLEAQGIAPGSYDLVPLDGMRKTVARRMTEAFRDVPHFPLAVDVEIDALLGARTKVNALLEKEGVKVSVNDMLIKAAALALKRVPDANVSYTDEGIAHHHHADIAVAVAIPGGLVTPVIRAAETKGLAEIAREMKDLAERARSRKLKPQEYQGGAFSLSNLGMFGIRSFASILNQPQACILSVGAGEKRPVARGDQLAIATVMTVTLTCDHRAVYGDVGARWLGAFKALVEDPITMIV
ncbi:MAG TPA: 2-oxo acid dehydrogenase subunit E2, partial [Caulobacteraceae bacterium]|nr:2-oxo acid dehydrogenase subunit E2 [Caulobacteraceae bacterium]